MESESFKTAKKVVENYTYFKAQAAKAQNALDYYRQNMLSEIDKDIESASVAHSTENTGSFGANVSADKIPNLALRLGQMQYDYRQQLKDLAAKQRLYLHIADDIALHAESLDSIKKHILKEHCLADDKKTLKQIAAELHLSEQRVKQLYKSIIINYANTTTFSLEYVLSQM